MSKTAIGVDVGGTNLRACLVTSDGKSLKREREASASDPRLVAERIEEMIARVGLDDVSAIGIGVPGRVRGRDILSGGFVDFSAIPLADRLERRFGLPVAI